MLEKHWDELQTIFRTALSSRLGYVDASRLMNAVRDARAGKSVPLVRVLWAISLEYWLRDLTRRGLVDAPATSALCFREQEVVMST
jgi:hypothetical protein